VRAEDLEDSVRVSARGRLSFQLLGPLRVWRDGIDLDAGPRQQAYLLALLLAREGQPVSTSELIDLIWDADVPSSALNIVQKYVGSLRRLLEPSLPARATGSYLHRRGPGYLFAAAPGSLDLTVFREQVKLGRAALIQGSGDALRCYVEALELWHGPAGDGFEHGPTSVPVFASINDEFFVACAEAAEVAVSEGWPKLVLQPLRLAAWMAPLHESVQASLMTVLCATGQQAEALSVFESVRERLADELGVDPGPTLRAAHQRVLTQAAQPTPPAAPLRADSSAALPARGGPIPEPAGSRGYGLVGRVEELAVLRRALDGVMAGSADLVVVEGEPGVGKTRLLAEVGSEAERRGALVVWGHCLDGDGAPGMWPWVQVVGALLDDVTLSAPQIGQSAELARFLGPAPEGLVGPVLPDVGAQFRLFEQVVSLVGRVAAQRQVMLVVDDLQWADVASLQMFSHLAKRLPGGTLLAGTLRDRAPAPGPELELTLAAVARLTWHRRIRLGPLEPDDVAELISRETGLLPSDGLARSIQARTEGNPFFVRELARLLVDEGMPTSDAAAQVGVPSTVRDIVRDRLASLHDDARGLVQLAALVGREVDLDLLARALGSNVQDCLGRLEPLEAVGLLESDSQLPFSWRFSHDLVRESVVRSMPSSDAGKLHLRIANALEQSEVDGEATVEQLAHHLCAAGPLAEPSRAVRAMVLAGRRAASKSALEAAAKHLDTAARVARGAGLAELELASLSELIAVVGMQSGYVGSAAGLLERAEHVARALGREREAADFLYSRYAAYSQGIQLRESGELAHRLLTQGDTSDDPILRLYGRHAWGIHQWDLGNVGEAYRYLSESNSMIIARRHDEPLRHDLQLLSPVMLALNTALHGRVEEARARFDGVEADAGDDPYAITLWAAFAVTAAALAGDPERAQYAAQRGIDADPEPSFVFLGTYQRLARCWARAVTGQDPAGAAAEARGLIDTALHDPPRSGLATWHALLADMYMAGGNLTDAAASLDRAATHLDTYGQRYPEGLVLLLRARLMQAGGASTDQVRAALERARDVSNEREAYLFSQRADMLLTVPSGGVDRGSMSRDGRPAQGVRPPHRDPLPRRSGGG
jgi:DNA-binding SARP family transcriptional activator/tetratricopeptide (TPR) repeat protein